jgi:ATP-dependent exoDNAse (exonuclease V) beta subunit
MEQIQWSYSSLKDYIGCPKRYQETKVLKNYEFQPTEATIYGNKVHSALEAYVKNGTELPANYKQYQGYADGIIEIPGEKFPEHKMALDIAGKPCKWGSKDRWVRGIADLIVINEDLAHIIDYKTGSSKYPDPNQLKLMALMVFAYFPKVNKINAALMFIMQKVIVDEMYTREQSGELWEVFYPHLERLKTSYENDTWPTNPTALCRFCPVATCNFNKA